jgi:acyl carrier protein
MTMTELHQELKDFIIETMNLEDITHEDIGDDTPLFSDDGLGLDSIDALELALALKKKYGITLEANDPEAQLHLGSIASLAELIKLQRTQNS